MTERYLWRSNHDLFEGKNSATPHGIQNIFCMFVFFNNMSVWLDHSFLEEFLANFHSLLLLNTLRVFDVWACWHKLTQISSVHFRNKCILDINFNVSIKLKVCSKKQIIRFNYPYIIITGYPVRPMEYIASGGFRNMVLCFF